MKLHLGEGAEDYLELIELAVEVWNEAVNLPSRDPLIEIVQETPQTYWLQDSFWSDAATHTRDNLKDDESVIYFKPSTEEEGKYWGYTRYQWNIREGKMIEADIYINTSDEEDFPGDTLVLTKKIVDVDAYYGAYSLYNKTYAVILHELGHAIGLGHIPVSGNVMGRDFGEGDSASGRLLWHWIYPNTHTREGISSLIAM